MWAETEPSKASRPPRTIAEIACQLCRRRKVKCDRTLPHCKVCIQTNQVCEYPLRPKKPGPKIGSLQRHKRRYRDRENGSTPSNANGVGSTASTGSNTNGNSASSININNSDRRNRNSTRRSSDKRSPRSPPDSSPSDAETTHDGSSVTANGGSSNSNSISRGSRGGHRATRNEPAFESVSKSVFEDDDEDDQDGDEDNNDDRRRRRTATTRRTRDAAPTSTEPNQDRTVINNGRTGTTSPAGTTNDEWTQRRRNSRLNINDLSFILHPSHEASTPEKDGSLEGAVNGGDAGVGPSPAASPNNSTGKDHATAGSATAASTPEARQQSIIQQACTALGVSETMLRSCIEGYFSNMVAINLFHQPSFADKLATVASPVQLFALLTAMMGYAMRFMPEQTTAPSQQTQTPINVADTLMVDDHIDPMLMAMPPPQPPQPTPPPTPEHFLDMARRLIERALDECGDDPPTLAILQACIIYTHCELTRGVHGRAWRSLGMCVRLAYEMNLHLVDARTSPASSSEVAWRDAEEKRRAWWAIWEMDVFASTIRRTPTAVDWTQMETLLPVDDVHWFGASSSEKRRSCFMELDPVRRWKALQASGNQSPKAWFLIINSLMKDARIISSPRGVPFHGEGPTPPQAVSASSTPRKRRASPPGSCPVEEARQKLEILANCVQCFVLALPSHLQYRNQFLGFGAEGCGETTTDATTSLRQLHCGIYNIFVMTQLTRLMIHRYELFGSHAQHFRQSLSSSTTTPKSLGRSSPLDNPAFLPYIEAADNILTIVNRSCEEHIQHINPFLLSTIWLAAAVQLVRRHVAVPKRGTGGASSGPLQHQQTLIKSRFEVLYLTYKRCAAFWNVRTAMEQNLEALESQLEGDRRDRDHDEEEDDSQTDVENNISDDEHGHPKKRDRANRDDRDQRKQKKTRVVKEKQSRVNGAAPRQSRRPAAASKAFTDPYTSWTRSTSNHQQMAPVVSPAPQSQTTTLVPQTQQQMAHTMAFQPIFQVPGPPAPLSTYSDPTGASSASFLGDGDALINTSGNNTTANAAHISPSTPTVSFPSEPVSDTIGNPGHQRRATASSSFNYFKFDSPAQQHTQPHNSTHANGYESSPPTNDAAQTAQAKALLTFMQMSSHNRQTGSHSHPRTDSFVVDTGDSMGDVPLSMISPTLFEPDLSMDDMQQQQNSNNFEWHGLDLPMDIHDLLSGFSAY
ncbi:hypothetical protein SEUCBS140593_003919 [Sporothrix eucalyptigena]|uniref:Zn(2)-C6 fungal-type domain-containing protein n=1 Tax=Sporothrix eucalyptigena TaxID=1812306 RepID=A0ABP0BIQ8_9PEZI